MSVKLSPIVAGVMNWGVWDKFENTSLEKDYELKNQMNGPSSSIMNNIAEGFDKNHITKEVSLRNPITF
jgi:four helix bundle protein